MRSMLRFLMVLLIALPLFADNETVLLLDATKVDKVIYVAPDGDKLKVSVDDNNDSLKPLAEKTTYKAAKTIDVAFKDFNPLRHSFTTSEKLSDDQTAKALADFLQSVIDTANAVGVAPQPNPTADTQANPTQAMQLLTADIEGLTLEGATNVDCTNYQQVHEWLLRLRALMNQPIITPATVNGWVSTTTSAQGVKDTRVSMKNKLDELDANSKAIADVLDAIRKKFARLDSKDLQMILTDPDLNAALATKKRRAAFAEKLESDDLKNFVTVTLENTGKDERGQELLDRALSEVDAPCDRIYASTFVALLDISRDAAKIEARKILVRAQLVTLRNSLERYEDASDWRDTNNYILLQPTPDGAKVNTITVKLTERVPATVNQDVEFTAGKESSGSFDLRKYSRVITEVAAALIYTDITYHEFGTGKNDKGETIVVRVDDSHFPVEGAMMLNLIPDWWSPSVVYPALQFGVSSAKDSPGFLGGVALRFTGMRQLSVSFGRMITWHKTLNKLQEGSVVTGTADIEADLKLKRAPAAWYGGIQYSF